MTDPGPMKKFYIFKDQKEHLDFTFFLYILCFVGEFLQGLLNITI